MCVYVYIFKYTYTYSLLLYPWEIGSKTPHRHHNSQMLKSPILG